MILIRSKYLLSPDSYTYIDLALEIKEYFRNFSFNYEWFIKFYDLIFSFWKPPLYPFIMSFFTFFVEPTKDIVFTKVFLTMSNMIYFYILLITIYKIGSKFRNKQVGLFASFIFSFFPTTFALSRVIMIEFCLAAVYILTVYCFENNRFYINKNFIFLICITTLGTYTKETYIIFLFPIFI
ncbi:MAG: glycosyltransferase family 39 protein, partial [Promethearchaeota archaeon]